MSDLFIAALLGSVQGITEFLPISSTAHLVILQNVFQLDQEVYGLSFDIFTSIGTTLAVIIYFRKELSVLLHNFFSKIGKKPHTLEERMPWWILGATVFVALAGYFLEGLIEGPFRDIRVVIASLAIFSIVMILAEKSAASQKPTELTSTRAYLVGLAQILAFFPGVSRSGATISTGLFLGLDRASVAKFSFLLSVPIFIAAIIKRSLSLREEFAAGFPIEIALFYLTGLVFATLVGYASIHFLLQYLKRHPLTVFAYYRLALAALILVLYSQGVF